MIRTAQSVFVVLIGVAVFSTGACAEDRAVFAPPLRFTDDVDAAICNDKCSLDGRSVVKCVGDVIEACPAELACGSGKCQAPCAAAAAEGSSNGCEFYLQPPLFISTILFSQSCYAAYIVNSSTIPVDVALEYEGKSLDLSKSMYRTVRGEATLTPHTGQIAPGDGVVLFVSDRPKRADRPAQENTGYWACPEGVVAAHLYDYYPKGTQFASSFRLSTSAPVALASIYPFGGAPTAYPTSTLHLPVATWSKENILINAWSAGRAFPPAAQIVASEDDTDVTIYPKKDIQDGIGIKGSPAGIPSTYRLQKGQLLQFVQQEELTGSFVTSTKPTSIFGAHVCADIPSDTGTCDFAVQQLPSYEHWGSEYVGAGYRPRLKNEHEPMPYRIVAVRDGTRLDYDPEVPRGAPLELNAGEMAEFGAGVGDAFVVRTQGPEFPVYLASYMTGQSGDYWGSGRDFDTFGDPEFVNVVPAGQYLTTAAFYADPTYAETSLVVVRAKFNGEFKDVVLECLDGPVTGFRPIGTRGEYEFARVDLSRRSKPGDSGCYYGAHRLRSDGPFTTTLWGWGNAASYGYPSGMATRKLVTSPLVTR